MKRTSNRFPGLYREDCGAEGKRYRILITRNKKTIQQHFYFRDATTEKVARAAAMARWQEIIADHPPLTKRQIREIVRKPTNSGIAGVTRIVSHVKDGEYHFWKATWTTADGQRKSRQFSIAKYGVREARNMAIAARQEALDEVDYSR